MAIPKRNKEMTPLKEAIERLLKVYKISDKMDEITLRKEWEELMGKAISNKTKRLELRKRVLIIQIESSVLRHELSFAKEKLKESLNRKLKRRAVDEIIFR
ncbi:MAG: putative nucleic acid-binding Zn ribbon protein [Flavobacteriales bacterium]|jgi:predicted nucleic acid-binding Zn ribbon protein|tara:strand:+ start:930 stop:1232 length:303 start_codon:yes stop_codon:yes gene_type:complete